MEKKMIRIDFEPVGKRVVVEAGSTLLEAAQQAGIELVSICGGMGTCGQCRVQVMSGAYSPVNDDETFALTKDELAAGCRLGCQAKVLESGKVHIPPDSLTTPQRLQLEGLEEGPSAGTSFQIVDLSLDEPDLNDLRSDAQRLADALEASLGHKVQVGFAHLNSLSGRLRDQRWKVRAVARGGDLVGLLPAGQAALGLAVDVGTTKVAAYLVDLHSGEVLARSSAMNPQIHYGEDVISRINYCIEREDGRAVLQSRIVETLNTLAAQMCAEAHADPQQVLEAVVVGNTAMHHLFAGLPVQQLGLSPFVPAVSEPVYFPAREIGLDLSPTAKVYLPANIAGYVGADHVAMVLATEAWRAEDTVIALDIGTNTEISLVHGGKMLCCSCASGPAFEGAHIHEGMRAAAGAVERVQIEDGAVRYFTIGGQPPVGVCGSGILDAMAQMYAAGILDGRGRLNSASPLVRGTGKDAEFLLAAAEHTGAGRDLTINRKDIYEIMLAKAAIQTGIEILLDRAGITKDRVDRFIVAGAFGTYLSIESAVGIGMFPDLPRERFSQVGNAAGTGARLLLASDEMRQTAAEFAARMQYVELTVHPRFNDIFLSALKFERF